MFKRIADTISPAAKLGAAATPPVRNGRPRRSRLGAFFPDITGFLILIVLFAAGAWYNPVPAIDAVTWFAWASKDWKHAMAEVFGVVYDPPRAGFPYLATVFMNGNLLHYEVVATLAEGETLLSAAMKEMQKHVQPVTNTASRWASVKGGFRQPRKPMCWPVGASSSSSF